MSLTAKKIEFHTNNQKFEEGVFCEINLANNDKLLCALFYRRRESNDENNDILLRTLEQICNPKYSHLLILQGFNLPKKSTGNIGPHVPVRNATSSTLDLNFSNEENIVQHLQICSPLGDSDHSILKFDFVCRTDEPKTNIKIQYHKGDYTKMQQILFDCEEEFKKINTQMMKKNSGIISKIDWWKLKQSVSQEKYWK